MYPTLQPGSFVIIEKRINGSPELFPGDIAIFRDRSDKNTVYIKRVIGISNDKITLKNNQLSINGNEVETSTIGYRNNFIFAKESLHGKKYQITHAANQFGIVNHITTAEYRVPDHAYFFMGDNRDYSKDSRNFGSIDNDLVLGKLVKVIK